MQARVTIVDTTDPGYVHFESSTATAHERAERVTLNVLRKRGATGALKVLYSTQSDTAVAGASPPPLTPPAQPGGLNPAGS